MFYRVENPYWDDSIAVAPTLEMAFATAFGRFADDETELELVSELPEDQRLLMSGWPMLPGLDLVRAGAMHDLVSDWRNREKWNEAHTYKDLDGQSQGFG